LARQNYLLLRSLLRTKPSATAINNRGQATGQTFDYVSEFNFGFHVFLYSGGNTQDLDSFDCLSSARAINNHGIIVGQGKYDAMSTQNFNPIMWVGTNRITLGNLGASCYYNPGIANAINDAGIVVGAAPYSPVPSFIGVLHAFMYNNGVMTDMGLGDGSVATGINNSNQVVGTIYTVQSNSYPYYSYVYPAYAFVWQNGKSMRLPTLGGTSNNAAAINDKGHVIGSSQLAGNLITHGFLYTGKKLTD
jgi:probable HAF family extracellular repeat protein